MKLHALEGFFNDPTPMADRGGMIIIEAEHGA